jgi:TonB family protein
MPRSCRLLALAVLPALGSAACMSQDDARKALDAVQAPGPPDVLPAMRNTEPPFHYPPALYAQKVQANVTLHLHIDSLGAVDADSTYVVETSGYSALDSAAIMGSRALQFTPARRDGRPVSISVKFPILFRHPANVLPADTTLEEAGSRTQEPER